MTLTQNVPRNVVFEVELARAFVSVSSLAWGKYATPRPNDRNMSMQHCWAQYVACVCPPALLRRVVTCWVSLAKFEDVKEKEKVKIQWKAKE